MKHFLKRSLQPTPILGASTAILDLLKKIDRIADTPVNVFITGETGTDKELVARTIHDKSARRGRPFIALNCTAIPESIFESEIFGIEKGVATGVEKRIGKLEQAQGGTVFFDEVGDMPLAAQGKILRVIEDRQVERIGGRTSIPADVRILAATNRNLKERIAKGIFREDLYYRLNVVNLHIPPLRERPEDIIPTVGLSGLWAPTTDIPNSPSSQHRLRPTNLSRLPLPPEVVATDRTNTYTAANGMNCHVYSTPTNDEKCLGGITRMYFHTNKIIFSPGRKIRCFYSISPLPAGAGRSLFR